MLFNYKQSKDETDDSMVPLVATIDTSAKPRLGDSSKRFKPKIKPTTKPENDSSTAAESTSKKPSSEPYPSKISRFMEARKTPKKEEPSHETQSTEQPIKISKFKASRMSFSTSSTSSEPTTHPDTQKAVSFNDIPEFKTIPNRIEEKELQVRPGGNMSRFKQERLGLQGENTAVGTRSSVHTVHSNDNERAVSDVVREVDHSEEGKKAEVKVEGSREKVSLFKASRNK
jgi:hypothetical protein